MKTKYVIPGVDPKLCVDTPAGLTAALSDVTKAKLGRARAQFVRGRSGYKPGHQPRDSTGRFRQILARLKFDIGDSELENIVDEIKTADRHAAVGDIAKATEAGQDVIKLVDDIKDGVLDPTQIKNIRAGAAELGRVLAYLPLPQGDATAKVKFSDLPPPTVKLIEGMIKRVVDKLGEKDAAPAVALLENFMAGGQMMTSDELSAELNKLLRLLT